MHIFLIGFMCAGKSRIGRALAPVLGLPFVDIDRVVEERVGPILPFVQREGEGAFRVVESEVLQELLPLPAAVIATGGCTPCSADNLQRMKAAGITLWLDVPMDVLMPRIERAGGDRPLLFGLKGPALHDRVSDLLAVREGIYAQADAIIQADASPEEVIARIRIALTGLQAR